MSSQNVRVRSASRTVHGDSTMGARGGGTRALRVGALLGCVAVGEQAEILGAAASDMQPRISHTTRQP